MLVPAQHGVERLPQPPWVVLTLCHFLLPVRTLLPPVESMKDTYLVDPGRTISYRLRSPVDAFSKPSSTTGGGTVGVAPGRHQLAATSDPASWHVLVKQL